MRRGFTLLELLIVVAVVGIAASVAVFAVGSPDRAVLVANANVLANDLRLARQMSIQHNTRYSATFDTDSHSYSLAHAGTGTAPAPKRWDDPTANYEVVLTGGIRIHSVSAGGSVSDVVFQPAGGTGPSRVQDTLITLEQSVGNDRWGITIEISWRTGIVRVGKIHRLVDASPAIFD